MTSAQCHSDRLGHPWLTLVCPRQTPRSFWRMLPTGFPETCMVVGEQSFNDFDQVFECSLQLQRILFFLLQRTQMHAHIHVDQRACKGVARSRHYTLAIRGQSRAQRRTHCRGRNIGGNQTFGRKKKNTHTHNERDNKMDRGPVSLATRKYDSLGRFSTRLKICIFSGYFCTELQVIPTITQWYRRNGYEERHV